MKRIIYMTLVVALLSGCIGPKKPTPATYFYLPEYTAPQAVDGRVKSDMTIKISRFSIAPEYSFNTLMYRPESNVLQKYHYHKWIVNPADFIGSLITRDLTEMAQFQAVLPSTSAVSADYVMEGRVNAVYEKNDPSGWAAVLDVSILVIDRKTAQADKKIVFQKTYKKVEPCEQKAASCLADGLSRLLPKLSEEIAEDILEN